MSTDIAQDRLDNQAEEIDRLRRDLAACASHVGELRWQAQITNERLTHLETQNRADDTDRYEKLRQIIKVIGLTEILAEEYEAQPKGVVAWTEHSWKVVCVELHRRYGHLQLDGKPLWSKPPAAPSPETKALIAESLRRRQET